jgi:hypothetical protein
MTSPNKKPSSPWNNCELWGGSRSSSIRTYFYVSDTTSATVNARLHEQGPRPARSRCSSSGGCFAGGMSLTSPPCSSSRSTTRIFTRGRGSRDRLPRQSSTGRHAAVFTAPTGTAAIKRARQAGEARKKLGTGSQGRRAAVPAVLRKSGPQ